MALFRRQPGFLSFHPMVDDDHSIVAHTWETRRQANAPSDIDAWAQDAATGTPAVQPTT